MHVGRIDAAYAMLTYDEAITHGDGPSLPRSEACINDPQRNNVGKSCDARRNSVGVFPTPPVTPEGTPPRKRKAHLEKEESGTSRVYASDADLFDSENEANAMTSSYREVAFETLSFSPPLSLSPSLSLSFSLSLSLSFLSLSFLSLCLYIPPYLYPLFFFPHFQVRRHTSFGGIRSSALLSIGGARRMGGDNPSIASSGRKKKRGMSLIADTKVCTILLPLVLLPNVH